MTFNTCLDSEGTQRTEVFAPDIHYEILPNSYLEASARYFRVICDAFPN